jgi:hypothetical protein
MNRKMKVASLLLGLTALTGASATTSINTFSAWNGTTNSGPFGEPDTATFGQSITTDAAGGLLQSFTFYLSPLDLDFRGYVFEWDGSKAVGPALFTSAVTNIGDAGTGYKPVTMTTGDIALKPSQQYVLLFSASGLQAGRLNTNSWASLRTNAYTGGEFVFHNSGNDISTLHDAAGWDCGDGCGFHGNGADLAFKAQISAVPELETYSLMLAGLGFVGLLSKRRSR